MDSDRLNKLWKEQGLGFAVYKANMTFQEGVEFADICDIRTSFKLDGKYKELGKSILKSLLLLLSEVLNLVSM